MVSNLTSEGVRVLVYINCLVTDVSKRGTPYRRNLYKEGLEKGYLVNLTNGEIWTGYTEGAMVDLTNPQAYSWYMSIIQEVRGGHFVGGSKQNVLHNYWA